jgi:hypothetical protein
VAGSVYIIWSDEAINCHVHVHAKDTDTDMDRLIDTGTETDTDIDTETVTDNLDYHFMTWSSKTNHSENKMTIGMQTYFEKT